MIVCSRWLFTLILVVVAGLATSLNPAIAEPERHHALSLIKKPKYPQGFSHFDYVNPDAPKGGVVRLSSIGSFDSLNPFVLKGVAAAGSNMIYDRLMASSLEEPATVYGQLAEWVQYPEDYSSVTFKLREEARWHDGEPVTPEDVIFSLNALKKGHPFYAHYYENIEKVEKVGEHKVKFTFDVKNNRELPMITGELTILPKHYWTGENAKGEQRDITETTLKPPLGSGPYRIKEVTAGRTVVYERVEDYWGKDLPVNAGQNNFEEIHFEYFRDSTVAFEAFKADRLDYYRESSSKNWATGYDFGAVENGWVKRDEVELDTGKPMQAFVFNTRREKFKNRRVRKAFNLAFNFQWANENLFYGQYERVSSYFQNTSLAARGLPEGQELEILEEVRGQVPEEVFTEEYENPVNESRRDVRRHLREATKLLKEAGWTVRDGKLVNAETGKPMRVEFLIVSPQFERIIQPYSRNLERLGIDTSIRLVDSAQYSRRLDDFDFDMAVGNFPQSRSPGNEQRDFWGSAAADKPGSRNLIGIKNPAVDTLIDKIIFAKDREGLVAATRALDRVLLWNYYVVPQWYAPFERVAYWNRFGKPETMPSQSVGFMDVWWWDQEAANNLAAVR